MHYWGDDWFKKNGRDLDKAIVEIMKIWRRYGRIGTHGKEKWGCFQDHVYFFYGHHPLHDLIYPGYIWFQWSKRMATIDYILGKIVLKLRLYVPILFYQKIVYNYAIQKVCRKYPHLIDELVKDLDHYELVKPGIFGIIDGTEIHNKYWRS